MLVFAFVSCLPTKPVGSLGRHGDVGNTPCRLCVLIGTLVGPWSLLMGSMLDVSLFGVWGALASVPDF